MKSPAEILTALAALWSRISSAIGRGQAEKSREQQPEIDAMDAEIQGMNTKESTDDTKPQATKPPAVPVSVDGRG